MITNQSYQEDRMYDSASPAAIIISIIVGLVLLVSQWIIFTKAGKPGWAVIIPIYNVIVLLQIVDKPLWWFFMFLIPIVNIVFGIIVLYNLVLKFGQPGWHVILALFLSIFYFPYLAFSKASYTG